MTVCPTYATWFQMSQNSVVLRIAFGEHFPGRQPDVQGVVVMEHASAIELADCILALLKPERIVNPPGSHPALLCIANKDDNAGTFGSKHNPIIL